MGHSGNVILGVKESRYVRGSEMRKSEQARFRKMPPSLNNHLHEFHCGKRRGKPPRIGSNIDHSLEDSNGLSQNRSTVSVIIGNGQRQPREMRLQEEAGFQMRIVKSA